MTSTAYSSRSAEKFVVRLREDQRERLKEMASRQHMSMNSYVTRCLERQLTIDEGLPADSPEFLANTTPSTEAPVFTKDGPCRLRGVPHIILTFYFPDHAPGVYALITDAAGTERAVPYEELEAY